MPVIEGYSFTVDLQDRGMVKTLRTIKSEAQALKNVMRADFAEMRNSEGSLAAYSKRLENTQLAISKYSEAIEKLTKANEGFKRDQANGSITDANQARFARNVNTIKRYKVQIASLQHQMEEDQRVSQRLGTGIDTLRKSTEAITTSTKSFSSALKEQGKYYRAEKENISGLRSARESLKSELRAEVSITSSLRAKQEELTAAYRKEKSDLAETTEALAKRLRELQQNKKQYGENSVAVDITRKKIGELNETIEKQEAHLYGLSEKLGKNSTTLANQAKEATKVASSYKEVDRASRSLGSTRLGSMFKAGSEYLQHYNSLLKESTANTRRWWSESKSSITGVGIAMGAATAGVAKAVSGASRIQSQYIQIKNLIRTSGETARASVSESNAMYKQGITLSERYGYSQEEIGKQYENLVRRGYNGKQALSALNSMLKAARASGDDLNDVVKVTSESVDAFGLRSTKTADMLKHTNDVTNALTSSADRTASGFQDIGAGMTYVASTGKTLGVSVEEIAASLGELSNRGISGTIAGTGLRKVLLSLIKPTKDAQFALKEAGLSVSDFYTKSGKLKRIDTVFGMINEHTKGWGNQKKGAFFKALFGTTGVAAGEALAQSADKSEKLDQNLTNLINHIHSDEKNNYVGRLAKKNMKSAKMQIKTLKQTALAFEYTIGSALLPAVTKVGQALGKWAMSKDGQATLKDANKYASDLGNTISKHIPDMIAFGKGLYDGFHGSYKVAETILTPVSKLVGWLGKASGNSHQFAHNLGVTVGVIGSIAVGLKLFKTLFGGVFAVGKDTLHLGSTIKDMIHGQNGEQQDLNDVLKKTNSILKENIDLQKQFYKEQQKSGDSASDIPSDSEDSPKSRTTLHHAERQEIKREADDTYGTFRKRLKARIHGDKSISWGEVFRGVKGAGKAGGKRGFKGVIGGIKSQLANMSADDKVNAALAIGFSAADIGTSLSTALKSHDTKVKVKSASKVIGTILGGGIGFVLGGPEGALIGSQLGGAMAPTLVQKVQDALTDVAEDVNGGHDSKGRWHNDMRTKREKQLNTNHNLRGIGDINPFLHPIKWYSAAYSDLWAELTHIGDGKFWKRQADPSSYVKEHNKGSWLDLSHPMGKKLRSPDDERLSKKISTWWSSQIKSLDKQFKPLKNMKIDWGPFDPKKNGLSKWLAGFNPQIHGKKPSLKKLKLERSSILPKINIKKWWSGLVKDLKKVKWPKLPKIKMPKLNVNKWWGGIQKWWHNIKWPKFPKIKMPKLNAEKWAQNVAKDIKGGWRGFTGWTSKLGDKSAKNLKNGWKGMQSWAKGIHSNVKNGWHGFTSWASGLGYKASTSLKNKWKGMKGFSSGVASNFKSGWGGMTHWFGNIGKSMVSNFKDKFSDIKDWVSDRIQDIQDVWDSAGKHVHSFLTKGHFANGTGPIQNPTLGILNDGNDAPEINNSEGILHKDGVLEMLFGRNVKRLLLPGDQVIKSSDMSKFLGIKHFAEGTTGTISAISEASFNKIIRIAQSMLKTVKSISSKISNLSKTSNDSTIHDATYSSSSYSSSKKKHGKSTKSMVPFSHLGFYGNLKSVVRGIIKSGSKEKVYLSQSTRRTLGYKNAKGSATVKASKSLLNRIASFYKKRKRENAKILAEQRKQRANAHKREQGKQSLLKREMDLVNAKYNARRKKAVIKKEIAAIKRKAREKARAIRKKARAIREGATRRRTHSYTTRTRSDGSHSRVEASVSHSKVGVSVSLRGASTVESLLKRIKGNHKLKITTSLSGGKSVKSKIGSILGKVNSSRSKRTMLIRIKHSGAHATKKSLSKILDKVDASRSKRTMLIHVNHDGVHDTKKLLKETIDEVANLKKDKKNELTVHVKHDGVRDTKKALESVASTGKKMWHDLKNYSKSSISKLKSQFHSFSSYYKNGWSGMSSGIRKTMNNFWSDMHSDTKHGLNQVIKVLRAAIGQINGVVKSFGGKEVTSEPKYLATGTGYLGSGQRKAITKPTLAVLNDGHDSPETENKEVVWTPWNNRFDVVPGQNTKALLMPGQEVLNATESKNLGFTHFATGTGALKHLYELAKKFWKHPAKTGNGMFEAIKGLTGAIGSLARGSEKSAQGQGVNWWSQLWKMVEDKVNDDAVGKGGTREAFLKYAEKTFSGVRYRMGAVSKSLSDCSAMVMQALGHFGINIGRTTVDMQESSGVQYLGKNIRKTVPGDLVIFGHGTGDAGHIGIIKNPKAGTMFNETPPYARVSHVSDDTSMGYGFYRVKGLHNADSKEPKIKAKDSLQSKIKKQVGQGFWKTIQKIADKYGENTFSGGIAGKPIGDISHWMRQAHIPRKDWAAINYIVSAESNWDPKALNPSSGTYGLGQMQGYNLHYYTKHGSKNNAIAQLMGIMDYIYDRYGSVASAVSFRKAHGWYANGGIANKPSIFGEAGPEMAIPLSTSKLERSRELVAQTLAMMSDNDSSTNAIRNQEIMNNTALNKLVEYVEKLTKLVAQLQEQPEMVSTNISVDGQLLAQRLDKYQRRNQRNRFYNNRMNRSSF